MPQVFQIRAVLISIWLRDAFLFFGQRPTEPLKNSNNSIQASVSNQEVLSYG